MHNRPLQSVLLCTTLSTSQSYLCDLTAIVILRFSVLLLFILKKAWCRVKFPCVIFINHTHGRGISMRLGRYIYINCINIAKHKFEYNISSLGVYDPSSGERSDNYQMNCICKGFTVQFKSISSPELLFRSTLVGFCPMPDSSSFYP